MLGWQVTLYRQNDPAVGAATFQTPVGTKLAFWGSGFSGFKWLDELVKDGKAVDLGGDGYPLKYTAPAKYIVPRILTKLPATGNPWPVIGENDKIERWSGATELDSKAMAACDPEEWLIVELWDRS